ASLVLHEPENVFQDDNGIVNDNSHRQGQSEKGHVVERKIHATHQRKGGDDGTGDSDRRDQHRAPVTNENPDDCTGKDAAENQVLDQGVNRGSNEVRNVVNDEELHARRHLGAQLLNLASHIVGNTNGVGAGLAQNLNADHVVPGIVLGE